VEAGLDRDQVAEEARDKERVLAVWAALSLLAQAVIVFVRIVDIRSNTSPESHAIVRNAQNVALK
jgi:hypothetical protein